MHKKSSSAALWVLAGAAAIAFPSCLLLQLELHPDSTCVDQFSGAFTLTGGGFLLILRPSKATQSGSALPAAHADAFRYAIRSGVLPLASLFSDWSGELAHHRFLLTAALRGLPAVTWGVLATNFYGMLVHADIRLFFLISALASTLFNLAAFSFATIALGNVHALENRLRQQRQLLNAPLA